MNDESSRVANCLTNPGNRFSLWDSDSILPNGLYRVYRQSMRWLTLPFPLPAVANGAVFMLPKCPSGCGSICFSFLLRRMIIVEGFKKPSPNVLGLVKHFLWSISFNFYNKPMIKVVWLFPLYRWKKLTTGVAKEHGLGTASKMWTWNSNPGVPDISDHNF